MAGNYIVTFSVYTLAMIGVIFVGLVVVKKTLSFTPQRSKNNFLRVETSLCLEPRKHLYVIKAGREKFLIASSGEGCHFMTKLDDKRGANVVGDEAKNESKIQFSQPPHSTNISDTEAIQEYFNYGRTT